MEYYSAVRKKEILPFVTIWMNLEGIMLSEISQTAGKILRDTTYKRKVNHRSSELELWSLGTGVRENGEVLVKGYKVSVIQGE